MSDEPAAPSREDSAARPADRKVPLDSQRERAALLAHLRHELRTPVNAILGYSEMLLEDAQAGDSPPRLVADLERIHAAGADLLRLINDLLDASQLERHAHDFEAYAAGARHDLRTPVNAILGYTEMLLEDAAEAGAAGPGADIERIHAAGVKLLERIEDIVRLSEVAAGRRVLESDGAPASDMVREVVSAIRPLSEREAVPADAAGGCILVVDDNEINRDMLSRRLTREGYSVAAAEGGHRALEMIREKAFDLVLLDVMMPGMNGYEVLSALKDDPLLRHIPVIMISALDEIDSVVRCIEGGAEDYLPKPFNPVLLKARIGACLEKKRLRDREVTHLRRIEEEKGRVESLLHVILPHEIVEELKANSQVRPKRYENVAVLFCDVVGFTPYCAGRDPEEVFTHLQELVEAYEELAVRHDLQKIKTIGDSFMATAGAIRPLATPALNAVLCGLEMVATARQLPAHWEVRVGIHVGPVMAGVVGHRQYLFDLWGDTVNTAARVESHGRNSAVNVSAAAWAQVADRCLGVSLGPLRLKGIGEMEVFRVDGLR
jgi:adenylate cyclase